MVAGDQDWEVATLDDLNTVGLRSTANFLNAQFPGTYYPECTPETFSWKLGSNNPAGRGFITVAISNGEVIGVFSLTRKTLIMKGEMLNAGEIGDAFTHPSYRRNGRCITPRDHLNVSGEYYDKSVFGRLVAETLFRARESGVEFVYGTPNRVARPSYLKRLGFIECSNGKIYSKYFLTEKFDRPRLFSFLVKRVSKLNYFYCKIFIRLHFGKDAVKPIEDKKLVMEVIKRIKFADYSESEFGMLLSEKYLMSRYINHPTMNYFFYEVQSKNQTLGIIIACEITRASGIKTLVVSDWLIANPVLTKRFHLVLGCLRGFTEKSQTISLWQGSKTAKAKFLGSGMFSRKTVSIVGRSLHDQKPTQDYVFTDFHFGWSDNG